MKVVRITLLVIMLTIMAFPGKAWAALYDDVQESLICPACLDDRMTVAACSDTTAEETRQDIQKRLASGETKEQIIDDYVAKYGDTVLAVPRKSGFNLTAWVIPVVSVTGGIGVVYFALTKWVGNHGEVKQNRRGRQRFIDSVDEERLNEEIIKHL